MDISQTFDDFAAQYEAMGRVADPTLAGELPATEWYQCVSLVKRYLTVWGVDAGLWGNATQYWTSPKAALLDKFSRIETQEPEKGDVVVLSINHIGISNGVVQGTTFQQLDQNGGVGTGTGTGADAIQVHTFKKSQILGVYRPISVAPPFTNNITMINPKQVLVTPGMHEWNLMSPTFQAISDNPVNTAGPNTIVTMVAILRRSDIPQYVYLLPNADQAVGYNQLDVTDYTPPPDPTPPAPPATGITTPAATPVPFPYQTTPFALVTKVPGYVSSATSALNHAGGSTLLDQGNYLQYEVAANGMIHIAKSNDAIKYWINPADNVKAIPVATPAGPVVPSPTAADNTWKNTLTPLLTSGKSIKFKILRDMYVHDLADSSAKGVELNESTDDKATWLPIRYWLVRNNMTYLVPFLTSDPEQQHFYAIPTTDIDSGLPNLASELYKGDADSEREFRKQQGRLTWEDQLYYAKLAANQKIAAIVKSGVRFMDIIKVKITKK